MASQNHLPPMAVGELLVIIAFLLLSLRSTDAQIGVCYGRKGANLPCAEDVVNLYNLYGIQTMRLYDPDQDTLQSLQALQTTWNQPMKLNNLNQNTPQTSQASQDDSWIQLLLGVLNEDIQQIATDKSAAGKWVQTNVVPYASSIKYISVGNEIHPSDPRASFMKQAMQNIFDALKINNLDNQIKVSTAIDTTLISNTYPPSEAKFINLAYITPILNFLATYDSPLFVNIQPYIAYINDPTNIKLDYALFSANRTVFTDLNTGLKYQNLFDAIYDAMYTAVQKVVTSQNKLHGINRKRNQWRKIKIKCSESGWPSKGGFHHRRANKHTLSALQLEEGGDAATIENARTYYTNLIKHVKNGTPLTQGEPIETYLFALFDEDDKPGDESEQHYGLFIPQDEQPKYGELDLCYCL